ncbi:BRCA1-A complex subunit Abraxas 1 isoform X2 [Dunckerocampus dactyliophorus]|uniref:BRCA1-A complex subunit Abraxas 1 isoform X2 n=1 Tax=Dunckerocampus dactyliophorus TaxID=161453 RepID=UPI002405A04C|nr:BRCA1-A complex subunit Abraxas 1 isoform X2 [Dunckerocampus dactyliophorus]
MQRNNNKERPRVLIPQAAFVLRGCEALQRFSCSNNMAEPTVRISGFLLTSLMFHHLNKDSDVEGLILGEKHLEEHVTISDVQDDRVDVRHTYSIHKHVCFDTLNTLYDSVGGVKMSAVQKVLGSNKQERVIGWYRQRRNSEQRMTLREKAVHENLKRALSRPHMIFVLLTPGTPTCTGSTYRTDYSAFLPGSRHVVSVPLEVDNMASLDHMAYWLASTPCSAPGYRRAVCQHSSKFLAPDGHLRDVDAVNAMNDSLQAELQRACGAVADSERAVQSLLADVSALRKKLANRKSSAASKGENVLEWRGVENAGDILPVFLSPAGRASRMTKNLCLQLAVRALRLGSPLYTSHMLTLDALPVADAFRRKKLHPLRPIAARKRTSGMTTGRERKRCKRPADIATKNEMKKDAAVGSETFL